MSIWDLPVAVIGAGPVGLAAAAHLAERGMRTIILESGHRVGASVLEWGHVSLFSPWRYVVDAAARRLLEADGWEMPDEERFPTGHDLVERYLQPLAALPQIAPMLHLDTRVTDVARVGVDELRNGERDEQPFELRVENGGIRRIRAAAVIDASGTWSSPNPIGANGLPATGESAAADRVVYGIPDVLGTGRDRYAGRQVAVIGSGHSAQHVVRDLAMLKSERSDTRIHWLVRRPDVTAMFGGGEQDQLPARGRLGSHARALVAAGDVALVAGFSVQRIEKHDGRLQLVAEDGRGVGPVDEIIGTTGFRPELRLLRKLRLDLDPAVEATRARAPLIDPRLHSCGSVPAHGYRELGQTERDLYIVGAKSYGRAPTFLLATGYEQVRSVVAALDRDLEEAAAIRLDLPETGVCVSDSVRPTANEAATACCQAAPQPPAVFPVAIPAPAPSCCGGSVNDRESAGEVVSGGCCA